MNDPIILRKNVRIILSTELKYRFSETMIMQRLALLMPEPVQVPEMKTALEWNHARGYVESRYNEDAERHEWSLTDDGKQKEGL
jgi:hypothetical protein